MDSLCVGVILVLICLIVSLKLFCMFVVFDV